LHADEVGGEKRQLRRQAGVARAALVVRHGHQREHQQRTHHHQARLAQALGQGAAEGCDGEGADAGRGPVVTFALAALALQADQDAATERHQQADDGQARLGHGRSSETQLLKRSAAASICAFSSA
jgi:hypothetical protein